MIKLFASAILSALLLIACGENAYKAISDQDPANEATKKLEQGNPKAAIEILLDALGTPISTLYRQINSEIEAGHTANFALSMHEAVESTILAGSVKDATALVSILSSAHAKLYGIDPLDLALALASNTSSSTESSDPAAEAPSSNEMALLFPVLPQASDENIHGLTGARILLDAIGSERMTKADSFKKALYLTANTCLLTKQLDKDGDGAVTGFEAADLSNANAELVLDLLFDAATTLAPSQEEDNAVSNETVSAEKIKQIRESILNAEGSSAAEKLQNYLTNQSLSSTPS